MYVESFQMWILLAVQEVILHNDYDRELKNKKNREPDGT